MANHYVVIAPVPDPLGLGWPRTGTQDVAGVIAYGLWEAELLALAANEAAAIALLEGVGCTVVPRALVDESGSGLDDGERWKAREGFVDGATAVLHIKIGGLGSGQITSAPVGIDVTVSIGVPAGATYAAYLAGTTIELTTTPDIGSTAAGWSGTNVDIGSALGGEVVLASDQVATSTIHQGDGMFSAIRVVTADTTVVPSDHTIVANTVGGPITVTLRPAADSYLVAEGLGQILVFVNSNDNTLTVDAAGAELIGGNPTGVLGGQGAFTLQTDGSTWYYIAI